MVLGNFRVPWGAMALREPPVSLPCNRSLTISIFQKFIEGKADDASKSIACVTAFTLINCLRHCVLLGILIKKLDYVRKLNKNYY